METPQFSEPIRTEPSFVTTNNAQYLRSSSAAFVNAMSDGAIDKYVDFMLSKKSEVKQNINIGATNDLDRLGGRCRRNQDSLTRSFDSLKRLHEAIRRRKN